MKNFLIVIVWLSFHLTLMGQPFGRDLFVGADFSPSSVPQNQPSTCNMYITNNDFGLGTGKDILFVNTVFVNLTWTTRTNALNTPPGGTWGSLFNWTYIAPGGSPLHGGWYGVNNVNLTTASGTFTFSTSGKNQGFGAGATINVGMLSPYNETDDDDNSIAPLITVTAPLPVQLSSFDAKSKDCNSVELTWNTASELNNAYFEVLRSSDGKEFLSLGRVEGSNAAQGGRYAFTDATYLSSGNKYLYRLRQVDFDGKMTYHDVISHKHTCDTEKSAFSIYPNPAFDRINTVFTGVFNDEVTLMVLGNDGSLIRKMNLAPVNGNLDVSDLAAGIYQIKVVNGSDVFLTKFIKID